MLNSDKLREWEMPFAGERGAGPLKISEEEFEEDDDLDEEEDDDFDDEGDDDAEGFEEDYEDFDDEDVDEVDLDEDEDL